MQISKKLILIIYKRVQKLLIIFRNYFWKLNLGSFGIRANIFGNITVYYPENVYLGSGSSINYGSFLNARDKIIIGENVHISPCIIINTGGLEYKKNGESKKHFKKPVIIESGAWIGSGAIINPGVIIGKNSVIGAGAVVTKNIPDYSVAVGVPAKVIKKIEY